MNNIKFSVETNADNTQVVIGAQTASAGDTEDRNYFLDPVMAVDIANAILHCAEDCGVTVQMQSTGISDTKRLRLIKRAEHVIRSLSGRKLPTIAAHVVDTILSEIL